MSEQKISIEEIDPISGRPMRELKEKYEKKGCFQIVRNLTKHRIRNGKLERWEPVGGQIEPISEEDRKRFRISTLQLLGYCQRLHNWRF